MAERHPFAAAGVLMRRAEMFRGRPGRESLFVGPDRMRGIEDVILALGAAQHVKGDETGVFIEMRLAAKPHRLEVFRLVLQNLEAVHRDIHAVVPQK